jgi:hypothetical protein
MPAWVATSPQDLVESLSNRPNAITPSVEDRIRTLEDSVERLRECVQLTFKNIEILQRNDADIHACLRETEDWKERFSEWGEALMNILWGPTEQEQAAPVTRLRGWIEDSPV